jgi:uncharacterized protein YdaU (DUF1376 family)
MKPDRFMPWYVSKYLGDTLDLSTVEHGAYLLLLGAMWMADGRIPNEPERLAAITKMRIQDWNKIGQNLISRFCIIEGANPGFVTQKRLLAELAKAKELIEKNRINGIKSGQKRQRPFNDRSTIVPTIAPTKPPTKSQPNSNTLPPLKGGQAAPIPSGGAATTPDHSPGVYVEPPTPPHILAALAHHEAPRNDPPPELRKPGPIMTREEFHACIERHKTASA